MVVFRRREDEREAFFLYTKSSLKFFHSRVVEHLLKNNANASKRDKKGFTAIHYASVKGNKLSIEMVSDTPNPKPIFDR